MIPDRKFITLCTRSTGTDKFIRLEAVAIGKFLLGLKNDLHILCEFEKGRNALDFLLKTLDLCPFRMPTIARVYKTFSAARTMDFMMDINR